MKTTKNYWFSLSPKNRAIIKTVSIILLVILIIISVMVYPFAIFITVLIALNWLLYIIFVAIFDLLKEKEEKIDDDRKWSEWVKNKHKGN